MALVGTYEHRLFLFRQREHDGVPRSQPNFEAAQAVQDFCFDSFCLFEARIQRCWCLYRYSSV